MSENFDEIFGERLVKDAPKEELVPEIKDEGGDSVVAKEVERTVEEPVKVAQEINWLEHFNKEFSKGYKDKEEVKALFDKVGKYDEIETSNKDLQQKLVEYAELAKKVNPMEYFASEDEYVRNQFLKANKGKYSEEVLNTLSVLSPEKVGKLSFLDAVKTDLMINKDLSSEEATAYVNDRYGIESGEELDVAASAKLKVDAKDAKSRLSKLYEGIDIPKAVDIEGSRTTRKEAWNTPLREVVKGIDKIAIAEGVDFVVDDTMKSGLEEEIMSELLISGVNPTEETLKSVVGLAKDRLVLRNIDKVVKSIEGDLREKIKAEVRTEVHNDKPLNNDTRSDAQRSRTADDVVLDALR